MCVARVYRPSSTACRRAAGSAKVCCSSARTASTPSNLWESESRSDGRTSRSPSHRQSTSGVPGVFSTTSRCRLPHTVLAGAGPTAASRADGSTSASNGRLVSAFCAASAPSAVMAVARSCGSPPLRCDPPVGVTARGRFEVPPPLADERIEVSLPPLRASARAARPCPPSTGAHATGVPSRRSPSLAASRDSTVCVCVRCCLDSLSSFTSPGIHRTMWEMLSLRVLVDVGSLPPFLAQALKSNVSLDLVAAALLSSMISAGSE